MNAVKTCVLGRLQKGRRLRSAPNVRALVASVLREVEASTTIDPAVRARLALFIKSIPGTTVPGRLGRIERAVAALLASEEPPKTAK